MFLLFSLPWLEFTSNVSPVVLIVIYFLCFLVFVGDPMPKHLPSGDFLHALLSSSSLVLMLQLLLLWSHLVFLLLKVWSLLKSRLCFQYLCYTLLGCVFVIPTRLLSVSSGSILPVVSSISLQFLDCAPVIVVWYLFSFADRCSYNYFFMLKNINKWNLARLLDYAICSLN